MQKEVIEEKIKQYIVETVLENDGRGLNASTKLIEGGVLDSFSLTQLTLFIEEEFGVEISPDKIHPRNFQTIGAVADMVLQEIAERQAA